MSEDVPLSITMHRGSRHRPLCVFIDHTGSRYTHYFDPSVHKVDSRTVGLNHNPGNLYLKPCEDFDIYDTFTPLLPDLPKPKKLTARELAEKIAEESAAKAAEAKKASEAAAAALREEMAALAKEQEEAVLEVDAI